MYRHAESPSMPEQQTSRLVTSRWGTGWGGVLILAGNVQN
jgi:hypothetical protein